MNVSVQQTFFLTSCLRCIPLLPSRRYEEYPSASEVARSRVFIIPLDSRFSNHPDLKKLRKITNCLLTTAVRSGFFHIQSLQMTFLFYWLKVAKISSCKIYQMTKKGYGPYVQDNLLFLFIWSNCELMQARIGNSGILAHIDFMWWCDIVFWTDDQLFQIILWITVILVIRGKYSHFSFFYPLAKPLNVWHSVTSERSSYSHLQRTQRGMN